MISSALSRTSQPMGSAQIFLLGSLQNHSSCRFGSRSFTTQRMGFSSGVAGIAGNALEDGDQEEEWSIDDRADHGDTKQLPVNVVAQDAHDDGEDKER